MAAAKRNVKSEALTDLILTLFRANNATLAWGDRLVGPFGLTSARWQILGAIVSADRPQPVAWLARDLGANRQNVQRIVNDLHKEGLINFEVNPHHRKAQLVVLTDKGKAIYEASVAAFNPKADAIAQGLTMEQIASAHELLNHLKNFLRIDSDIA